MRAVPVPASGSERGEGPVTTVRPRRGWLTTLRRFSGLGAVLFAFVFLVGTARVQALALAAGDDELCVAMGGAIPRVAEAPAATPDLADRHHACCDLGLCLDASALPPSGPLAVGLARASRLVRGRRPRLAAPPAPRRHAHRPRGPPTA